MQTKAFEFAITTSEATVNFTDVALVVAAVVYFFVASRAGNKSMMDPCYLKKCSVGSLTEICRSIGCGGFAVGSCVLWRVFTAVMIACIYLDLGWIIARYVLKQAMPPIYTDFLIGVCLSSFVAAIVSKIIIQVVLYRNKAAFSTAKVADCFC